MPCLPAPVRHAAVAHCTNDSHVERKFSPSCRSKWESRGEGKCTRCLIQESASNRLHGTVRVSTTMVGNSIRALASQLCRLSNTIHTCLTPSTCLSKTSRRRSDFDCVLPLASRESRCSILDLRATMLMLQFSPVTDSSTNHEQRSHYVRNTNHQSPVTSHGVRHWI